jgi:hypothetical protein
LGTREGPETLSETAAIEVTGLTRRFGGRTTVDEVTFTVSAGKVFRVADYGRQVLGRRPGNAG